MKRRSFLKASVVGGALTFPVASLLVARNRVAVQPTGLQKLFGGEQEIQALGNMYRAAYPHEDSVAALRELIGSTENMSALADSVRNDFEGGNVVHVDGWVLSRTEARHCALYSLLSGKQLP